jgi:hypothetical protein
MTLEQHKALVKQGIEERNAARRAMHACPMCKEPQLAPMGGPGSYWFECQCGAYSPLKPTLEEALNPEGWQMVDPDLNALMYPPIGG